MTDCTVSIFGQSFRGRVVGSSTCRSTGKPAVTVVPEGCRAKRDYWPEQVQLDGEVR